MTQVIGLTNEDPVSAEYRPLKQIIERLNRTFKGHYRATTGFGSEAGSVSFVTMFVAYFNFLRPHAKLEKRVPVAIPELEQMPYASPLDKIDSTCPTRANSITACFF